MISPDLLNKAMSYTQYRNLLQDLFAQGKTTGNNQSEEYLGYAKINLQRMQRLEKTTQLSEDLRSALSKITKSYIWLVITEGWCGDAAQNLPVLHLLAQEFKVIELKLILRDEHLEVMDQYLTNGSRSIPKLICLEKDSLKEKFVWGPRPAVLQDIVIQMKKENKPKSEKGLVTQNWYNMDKTRSLQLELLNLVRYL
jgi:hypothetical protein